MVASVAEVVASVPVVEEAGEDHNNLPLWPTINVQLAPVVEPDPIVKRQNQAVLTSCGSPNMSRRAQSFQPTGPEIVGQLPTTTTMKMTAMAKLMMMNRIAEKLSHPRINPFVEDTVAEVAEDLAGPV